MKNRLAGVSDLLDDLDTVSMNHKRSGSTHPTPLIVGVGASAGGFEAFGQLLEALGDETRLAIVFVPHLQDDGKSHLIDLLSDLTELPVQSLSEQTKLLAGHIYLAPPKRLLSVDQFTIKTQPCTGTQDATSVIDHFFHSLADEARERAVGVILSGTGSDGTLGLKAISDAGGLTFAQEPSSAKFDSMPRSAATTGVADYVMTPTDIAAELIRCAEYRHDLRAASKGGSLVHDIEAAIPLISAALLRDTNYDFQHYKTSTIGRRIQRRMLLLQISNVQDYVDYIQNDPAETQNLFRELLIGVTAFFRDPESFDVLAKTTIPQLFSKRAPDDIVRIWVPGCATGQEAYSIAMLCREYMDTLTDDYQVQILATDIDERALKFARSGIYPATVAEHVAPERLERFFVWQDNHYTVKKEIRDLVRFSTHNLISDPPFLRQDLISCRNLLIYLGAHLQKKLIPLFHNALRPEGYLFLGPSESIAFNTELFTSIDSKHRISKRRGTVVSREILLSTSQSPRSGLLDLSANRQNLNDISQLTQRILLDQFAPKCCVVDEDRRILFVSSDVSKYITAGEGKFKNDIVKMGRRGLRNGLRAALAEAKKKRSKVKHEHLSVQTDSGKQAVMLTVQPIKPTGDESDLFMIVFHDLGAPSKLVTQSDNSLELVQSTNDRDANAIIHQLECELETVRLDLEQSIQEMEAANEELKTSNEELLSMNEELHSTNEELETSKDEIRATSDALSQVNSDLKNLLRSSEIAAVFLDAELRIRFFTPAVTQIYELIPADVGRPLSMFVPKVDNMPTLDVTRLSVNPGVRHSTADCESKHRSFAEELSADIVVKAHNGRAYVRRFHAYYDAEGNQDGFVVTFADATRLAESERRLSMVLDATSDGAWDWYIATGELMLSDRWIASLGYTRDEINDHISFWESIVHPDDLSRSRDSLDRCLAGETTMIYCESRLRAKSGEYRWMLKRGHVVERAADGTPLRMVGTDTEITDRKQVEKEVLEAKDRLALSIEVANLGASVVEYREHTVELSAKAASIYGLGSAEITISRDALHATFHPDDVERLEKAIGACLDPDGQGRLELDHRICHSDGSVRWVSARKHVYFDRSTNPPRPTHATLVTRDITERKQAEKELADREAHLRRVINHQLGFVGVIDVQGRLVEVDDRSIKIGKSKREDVIGKQFAETPWWRYDPAVTDQMRAAVKRAFAGEVVRFDVSMFAHGNDGVMIDFMIAPVFGDDGEVQFLVPSGVDIRERYAAEQKLKSSEEFSRTVLQSSPDCVKVLARDGSLQMMNELGMCQMEIDDFAPLCGSQWSSLWPEGERLNVQQAIDNAVREGSGRFQAFCPTAKGTPKWWDVIVTPVRESSGQISRFVAVSRDITDSKFTEERVRASEERLRLAMGAAELSLWEWDLATDRITWADELFEKQGIQPQQSPGGFRDFLNFVHEDDRDDVVAKVEQSIAEGSPYRAEFRMRRFDGSYRWLLSMGKPIQDDNNKTLRLVGVEMDISQQREIRAELQKARDAAQAANESKSEFVANMSHEIRTPMTAILGYSELINELITSPEAKQHLAVIQRNGDYLLEIINDILDLSKIEAGMLEIDSEQLHPTLVIEDVLSIMEVRARERGLELTVDYATRLPLTIKSDAKRLKQILINLVGNAIKFTPKGSVKIRVQYQPAIADGWILSETGERSASNTAAQLHIDIIDTGIGMSDEQRAKLFQPFSQGDGSVTRVFGGTGLGLTISQRLAGMLGGKVSVSSTLGVGSTFSVSIATGTAMDVQLVDFRDTVSMNSNTTSPNLVHESSLSKVPGTVELEALTPLLNCRVLVVDDRRDIRFLSKRLLTKAGATVDECEDGQLAVDHIKRCLHDGDCPDLILLDMQMPNLDGYETARQLRLLNYKGPIIALTADAMKGDAIKCINAGCNDHLTKPINAKTLVAKVYEMTSPA